MPEDSIDHWDKIMNWVAEHGVNIVLIFLVAFLVDRFLNYFIGVAVKQALGLEKFSSKREQRLREKTIINLARAFGHFLVIAIVILLILNELAVNLGALLAGAGVLGFIVGFGAQSLIKDLIAGIYIVIENQYRVGDVVELNGINGKVKKITTRITVLRDLDGNVHYIPNGSITTSTNKTMEYAQVNLKVMVSYDSDIDKVKSVINEVGNELAGDEEWGKYIIEAPYFDRVNDFADSGIVIRIFGKTQPAKQWGVEGELRRRIKLAFDKHKITIPYPQVVVHQKSDR